MDFVLAGIGWLICGVVAAGFFNRHHQESFYAWSRGELTEVLAGALGMSLLFGPIALVMSPFMTGFFMHGWSLSPRLQDRRNEF